MSETSMWGVLRDGVFSRTNGLVAQRVENRLEPKGFPDVVYCLRSGVVGFMELKEMASWPARGGVLRVPHYTTDQKCWARKWTGAGAVVFLMLKVRQEWMLFDGDEAADVVGQGTRDQLLASCMCKWDGSPDDQLISILEDPA